MPLPLEPSQILLAVVLARSAIEMVCVAGRQVHWKRKRWRAAPWCVAAPPPPLLRPRVAGVACAPCLPSPNLTRLPARPVACSLMRDSQGQPQMVRGVPKTWRFQAD